MIQDILHRLKILYSLFFSLSNGPTARSTALAKLALACAGTSLVPAGYSVDLGCAISVNRLFEILTGKQIGGDSSTYELQRCLINSDLFAEVMVPLPGDIIISATGTSLKPNPAISHGHVGVVTAGGIMSNSSDIGLWVQNYNLISWKARYADQGGYRMRYFRAL